MRQSLRRIGNSQGVILPRPLLQQTGISDQIEMEVVDGAIVLKPAQTHPRSTWDDAFEKALDTDQKPDADLFDGMTNSFDQTEWQW